MAVGSKMNKIETEVEPMCGCCGKIIKTRPVKKLVRGTSSWNNGEDFLYFCAVCYDKREKV